MRIGVVGAGALGGFYGAKLARQGYDVHFLFRRDYQAVLHNGLTVRSWQGDFHLPRVNAYRDPAAIGRVDVVFIGLKTTANDHYAELIEPLVAPTTMVLTAQNGLGNEERLAELFGAEKVAGALAFLCSNRVAPAVIEHSDYGYIKIGNFQRPPDPRLRQFGVMLAESGIECEILDNLAVGRWKKLVWNVPFNGLSALLGRKVDAIMANASMRCRAGRLMKEVQAAAAAQGLTLEDAFLDKMMADTQRMKPYLTSMHLDARNHQPMEVESIIGEPLRRGQQHGVAMPETQILYEALVKLDGANRNG